jgi:hypothetical protein
MGHWVTLDDDQHVYISDGGKVLATRSAISKAGGAKERGKALAARSKAAIGKAMAGKRKAQPIQHGYAGKYEGGPKQLPKAGTAAEIAAAAKAHFGRKYAGTFVMDYGGVPKIEVHIKAQDYTGASFTKAAAGYKVTDQPRGTPKRTAEAARIRDYLNPDAKGPVSGLATKRMVASRQRRVEQTTRAIEHARAAGPSLREQAEQARAGKGTREQRLAGLSQKSADSTNRAYEKATFKGGNPDRQWKQDKVTRKLKDALGKEQEASGLRARKQQGIELTKSEKSILQAHDKGNVAGPIPHPTSLKGMSASAGDAAGLARERAKIRGGLNAVKSQAIAARDTEPFALGAHDAKGVYREGTTIKITGTKTITNPITGKGKVTIPVGTFNDRGRTGQIDDQEAMALAGKIPRASGQAESPATARAIEHARAASEQAAGPSLSREQRIRIVQEQAKSPAGKKALEKATGIRPIVKRKRA